jgi:hypothetical protein
MSFLTKSLEKRIQELRASIEAQSTELTAYEQVLALESGKPAEGAAAFVPAAAPVPPMASHTAAASPSSGSPMTVEFNGSRSHFVAAMLEQSGSAGVTPSEISAAFAARKIAVSKNLVYNVLSVMFKRKLARKSGGRYFPLTAKAPAKTAPKAAAKAAKKVAVKAAPAPATKKRQISEEGMRRIIAATKKRWALARAAKAKGR